METEHTPSHGALLTLSKSLPSGTVSGFCGFVVPCSAVLSFLCLVSGTPWVVTGLRSLLEQLSMGKVPRPVVVVKAWSRLETTYLQPCGGDRALLCLVVTMYLQP